MVDDDLKFLSVANIDWVWSEQVKNYESGVCVSVQSPGRVMPGS